MIIMKLYSVFSDMWKNTGSKPCSKKNTFRYQNCTYSFGQCLIKNAKKSFDFWLKMFMSGIECGIFWDIFCSVFYSYPYSIGSMVSAISSMQSSSPSTCSSTMIWTGQSSVKVSLYSRKEEVFRKKRKKSKLEYTLDNILCN